MRQRKPTHLTSRTLFKICPIRGTAPTTPIPLLRLRYAAQHHTPSEPAPAPPPPRPAAAALAPALAPDPNPARTGLSRCSLVVGAIVLVLVAGVRVDADADGVFRLLGRLGSPSG